MGTKRLDELEEYVKALATKWLEEQEQLEISLCLDTLASKGPNVKHRPVKGSLCVDASLPEYPFVKHDQIARQLWKELHEDAVRDLFITRLKAFLYPYPERNKSGKTFYHGLVGRCAQVNTGRSPHLLSLQESVSFGRARLGLFRKPFPVVR